MLTQKELVSQLTELGLKEGDLVHVKVSLRSLGKIEGGAKTIIDSILAVIGKDGTLVCDSFNPTVDSIFRLFKKKNIVNRYSKSYAGAFVNAAIEYPNSYRSSHPIQAFTAIGKYAQQLTEEFNKDSKPYGFLEKIAQMGGVNLSLGEKVIGVGTTHVAILDCGLEQKGLASGVYYRDENNKIRFYKHHWASGCPKGFSKLVPYYERGGAIISRGEVGNTIGQLSSMSKTLEIEKKLFHEAPSTFFCGDPSCLSCSFNWKHSKYTYWECVTSNIKNRKFKRVLYATIVKFFGVWEKD